jgi:hypothetical protein
MALTNTRIGEVTLSYRGDSLRFSAPMGKMEAIKQEYRVNPYLLLANIAEDPMVGSKLLHFLQVDSDAPRDLIAAWIWGDMEATTTDEWREMMVEFISDLIGADKVRALNDYHDQKKVAAEAAATETATS